MRMILDAAEYLDTYVLSILSQSHSLRQKNYATLVVLSLDPRNFEYSSVKIRFVENVAYPFLMTISILIT